MLTSLAEWNHWWKEKRVEKDLLGRERKSLKELKKSLGYKEIKLLIGIRRSGKSTLFYQLVSLLLERGIDPKHILLVNFEDDVLSKETLKDIFNMYQSNINPEKKPYLFIDEVHRCKEWALFLRKLYDLKKTEQIFITDSSSKFIKSEYAQVLTGRNLGIDIFPLSFNEYLDWKGVAAKSPISREDANRIKKELLGYLKWGGFPEVYSREPAAKKKLLTEYFSDIINKDIIERYNLNYSKVKPLADFLVTNSTKPFSPRRYSREHNLSLESISTYIQYFKEVSLFHLLPRFAYSIRAQQLSPKKAYVADLGFFNNLGFRFSENIGRAYENAVFLELKRKAKELYYWNGKHECDFLIKEGIKVKAAIQVCYELTRENKERELNGLVEAMDKFKLNKGLIITADYEKEEKVSGKKVIFVPLWKWLIEK